MRHHATSAFWKAYDGLPERVREAADRSFLLIKTNPAHPSLHFKQVGRFWSARVDRRYRVLAVEQDDALVRFWIGSHTDYDRLIG